MINDVITLSPKEINKINKQVKEQYRVEHKIEKLQNRPFYDIKSILGNTWATFYILLGGAQAGKSYSVMDFCLRQQTNPDIESKFYWFRLKDNQSQKLLKNNAQNFIDPDLLRKYNLTLKTIGSDVYTTEYKERTIKRKDGSQDTIREEIKDKRVKIATILDLSTFYNDKGVGYFDKDYTGWYNICIDEFQPEKGERRTFDIVHAFIRALENLVRNSKFKVRVFMMANLLEEASDILSCFNFLPEEFGRYKLVKNKAKLMEYMIEYNKACELSVEERDKRFRELEAKYYGIDFGPRAVIDYIQPTESYKKMRNGSIADRMLGNNSEYSNEIKLDKTLVYKGRINKPTCIIKFSKDSNDWFTLWDGKVIKRYNNENKQTIAMRPYIDDYYIQDSANTVINNFDLRQYVYKDLITFKLFQKNIMLVKPRGK